MKYYDEEDEVHQSLKKTALEMGIEEISIVYAEPVVSV
jgi:hypothetical protein